MKAELRHVAARTLEALHEALRPALGAITALMRRLVVLANALLRDDRTWAKTAA